MVSVELRKAIEEIMQEYIKNSKPEEETVIMQKPLERLDRATNTIKIIQEIMKQTNNFEDSCTCGVIQGTHDKKCKTIKLRKLVAQQ